jgi:hypothetical protein
MTNSALLSSFFQGDFVKKSLPEITLSYPPSAGWVLKLSLVSAQDAYQVDVGVVAEVYELTLSSAQTGAWCDGIYSWQLTALKAPDQVTVAQGSLTVKKSLFGKSPFDPRSQARRSLDNINAVLENRASSATLEYQIAGRQLKYIPVTDLITLQSKLRLDVAKEQQANDVLSGLPYTPHGRTIRGFA